MENVYRRCHYEKLKNIIVIKDEQRFFIDDRVVTKFLSRDRTKGPLDISIGVDCSISAGVSLGKNVSLGEGVVLDGTIVIGNDVKLGAHVRISTLSGQVVTIGDHTEILGLNIIQGNVDIKQRVRIERNVSITGSDEYPVVIGEHCILKGTSYVFGCQIEAHNWIEHSVLHRKKIECIRSKSGEIKKVCYVLPIATGLDVY